MIAVELLELPRLSVSVEALKRNYSRCGNSCSKLKTYLCILYSLSAMFGKQRPLTLTQDLQDWHSVEALVLKLFLLCHCFKPWLNVFNINASCIILK